MSTSRKEELIKKGFIKAILDGTIELKDLAGMSLNLDTARQAHIQELQEKTRSRLLTANQYSWNDLWTGDIGLNSVTEVIAYVVPYGYRLFLIGGTISCNASCIQMVRLVHTPGIVGDFRYVIQDQFYINPPYGEMLDQTDILIYYVFNNDKVERSFSVSLLGILEKITDD